MVKRAAVHARGPLMACLALFLGTLLLIGFDVGKSHSKYLYFSTEVLMVLFSAALYIEVFRGKHFADPAEPEDARPKRSWRQNALVLCAYFFVLSAAVAAAWIASGLANGANLSLWFRQGTWFLLYLVAFLVFFLLIRNNLQFIHFKALVVTVLLLGVILTSYEVVMLAQGGGWKYNGAIVGWVLGIPLDNVLFVYPLAPSFCIALYTILTRNLNDVKAFWASIAILAPTSAVLEWIAIGPLNLWDIFPDHSILPIGETNLEEFLYYIVFQALSILLYMFFAKHLTTFERQRAPRSLLPRMATPVNASFGLIIVGLVLMSFDYQSSQSKYLYASSEVVLLLLCVALYFAVFPGARWDDAPEPQDRLRSHDWRHVKHLLGGFFVVLAAAAALNWVVAAPETPGSTRAWLRTGSWYGFYVVVFGLFLVLVRRHLQTVRLLPIFVSTFTCAVLLCGYEAVLLSQGTGWRYDGSVIGWIFGIPIENLLFIYPVAPALNMILFSIISRRLNDLKAFWLLIAMIVPAAAIVELIGIYPLHLWDVFNDKSIMPLGRTNLEEFVYYAVFQVLSILIYAYFVRNIRHPERVPE